MMLGESDSPFYALVSNFGGPTWKECGEAFRAFYENFLDGRSLEDSVAAMRAASGNQRFGIEYGRNVTGPFNSVMERIRRKEIGDKETAERLYERYAPLFERVDSLEE